jgi:hypothetical protein
MLMKKLKAPLLITINKTTAMEQVSSSLDELDKELIDIAPWPEYNYKPGVSFSIAHGDDCIFLKFYVTEDVVKASYFKPNDPVYKDSCVEFFISFDEDEEYYNLEFNAIGTCKLNFGKNRNERLLISEELIKTIRFLATFQNNIANDSKGIKWELALMIPVDVFSKHNIKSLSGRKCAGNFYKCGDDLPVPHFLCWNNIQSVEPDFHLRKYFGEIMFL